jgi:single-stranded-DNA-specific exonuclease
MPDSLFNIQQSLMRSRWVMPDVELSLIEQVARKHGLPEPVARMLCARNVADSDIPKFLSPTLKNDFPDPFSLTGMRELAEHVSDAIIARRKISIFGDFDVDGATSSAILHRFLKYYGVDAPIYIPDRLTEGYGPNTEALQKLKTDGAEIVFLLDCGTTAFDIVAEGKAMGLEIIILDHHEAEDKLPDAKYIINPKRKDDVSGLSMLAACGVTFLTCVAINNRLKEKTGQAGPDLKNFLDLVALGTVCDMVPLKGANRLFVKAGFEVLAARKNPGIKALLETAKVNSAPDVFTAGFVLGPRINAGSRVHKADLGAQLLSTDDAEEAKNIAWTLHDCNEKRKEIQAQMEFEAIQKVEASGLDQFPAIVVDDESWHPGLAGLVAGRLKEKYGKPSCVITYTDNGKKEGKGSGRSVPGINIAKIFIDARNKGFLEKGGGHAMAGGFTVLPENITAFREFVYEQVKNQAASLTANSESLIDGVLSVRGLRADFVKLIRDSVGPFGQEHPEPLFVINNVRIHSADVVGSSHVRVLAGDWEGGTRLKAVAFRAVDTPLGDALLKQGRRPFHLCGTLKINEWQGRESVEMHIKDAAFAMDIQEEEKKTA